MKRSIMLGIMGMLLIGTSLYAANGDLIVNGSAGLGTAYPWSKTSVYGGGTAGDVSSARQLAIGLSLTHDISMGYYQTGLNQPFAGVIQSRDFSVGTFLSLNPSGGNVGIGTPTPWAKASVYGGGTVGDYTSARQLAVGLHSANNISMGYYQTGPSNYFAGVIQASDLNVGTALSLNPSGGNVGIGTTTPNAKLQIKGSVSLGNAVAPQANRLLCWTSIGTIGYCESVIAPGVSCNCSAIN